MVTMPSLIAKQVVLYCERYVKRFMEMPAYRAKQLVLL